MNRHRKHCVTLALASVAAVAVGPLAPVYAVAGSRFSVTGVGCVPFDVDMQANNYETAGHGVYFKGSATGDIRLVCPIQDPEGTFSGFTMYYRDPDGMGTSYRVRAQLKKAVIGTTSSTVICTTDSNTNSATGYSTRVCDFTNLTPKDDYDWFWFEIIIERTSSSDTPEFLGVSIFD